MHQPPASRHTTAITDYCRRRPRTVDPEPVPPPGDGGAAWPGPSPQLGVADGGAQGPPAYSPHTRHLCPLLAFRAIAGGQLPFPCVRSTALRDSLCNAGVGKLAASWVALPAHASTSVSAMQFDHSGLLLACGKADGRVAVFHYEQLRAVAVRGGPWGGATPSVTLRLPTRPQATASDTGARSEASPVTVAPVRAPLPACHSAPRDCQCAHLCVNACAAGGVAAGSGGAGAGLEPVQR